MNALLSFGYVIVGNELQSLLDGIGYDPFVGFFHQIDYGRPSLALDLLEEFRAALVDRFTLGLLNLRILKPEDFVGSAERGVALTQEGKKRYFRAYEEEMAKPIAVDGESLSFRQIFRRQAHRLEKAIVERAAYEPFVYSC